MRKNINKIILLFSLFFFSMGSNAILAAENPYYNLGYHDCTWTAWQLAYNRVGVVLPRWGYADDWYDFAERDGYPVGQDPAVNSIIVWRGHVGFVAQVEGNYIYVLQGGGETESGYWENWYDAHGTSSSGKAFIGYVYLSGIPSQTKDDGTEHHESVKNENDEGEKNSIETEQNETKKSKTVGRTTSEESDEIRIARLEKLRQLQIRKKELQTDIDTKNQEIETSKNEIAALEKALGDRIRAVYMVGSYSYFDFLFSGGSFKDFFYRFEAVKKIITSDQALIERHKQTRETLQKSVEALEKDKSELEEIRI